MLSYFAAMLSDFAAILSYFAAMLSYFAAICPSRTSYRELFRAVRT